MQASFGKFDGNLGLRPARDQDAGFLENLYRTARPDLRLLDAEQDFIEELILMQHQAQIDGYGEQFPDAWHYIVELMGERIGRLILDFSGNQVLIVDLSFIPEARGHGYGSKILKGLQAAAAQVKAPLVLSVSPMNPGAKQLYLRLGFQVVEAHPALERLAWFPPDQAD